MYEKMVITKFGPNNGICSFIPRDVLDFAMKWSTSPMSPNEPEKQNSLYLKEWTICDPGQIPLRIGIGGCMVRASQLETDNGDICYVWKLPIPNSVKLVPLLRTIMHLGTIVRDWTMLGRLVPNIGPLDLGIEVFQETNYGLVRADVGHEIWDAIRSPGFEEKTLPKINTQLESWFRNRYGNGAPSYRISMPKSGAMAELVIQPGDSVEPMIGKEQSTTFTRQFNSEIRRGHAETALGMVASMCILHKNALDLINSR